MQLIQNGFRGLSLVLSLNFDRIVIPLAIVVGLLGGAMIGAELMQMPPIDLPAVH